MSKGKFDIYNIPYNKIKPSKKNFYGLRYIEELAASIEESGLLHNLVVAEPDEAGFYELLSGERRFEALGLLKWETVPCKVEKRENEAIDELKLIYANSTARILTDYEKTTQAKRIKELMQQMKADGHKFKGRMRDIVADLLKVSPAQVGRMESINKNLSPELKEAFEREEIGITDAYNASLLDNEQQAAALEEIKKTGKLDTAKRQPIARLIAETQYNKQNCKQGGKCTNAKNLASFVVKGSIVGCAGCCRMCKIKSSCAKVCAHYALKPAEKEQNRIVAWLDDVGGTQYEASGSLAVIAAVDGENFSGYFSTGKAAAVDFIMLATAIVGECLERLKDSNSKDALKTNLAALFESGFEK